MGEEMLEIVDENDIVIGTAPRQEVHAKGLLHREIGVFFVTPQKQIIFQRRSLTKDIAPGRLDATVSGHVEIGHSYTQTALKEIFEETGLRLQENDLHLLSKERLDTHDPARNVSNCRQSCLYGHVFTGASSDLTVETGAADGFEAFDGESIFVLPVDEQNKFPLFKDDAGKVLYRKLLQLVE